MFRHHMFHGDRFARGPFREVLFHKGDLKYVILDMIRDKPRHGYEIIRELEEQSHGFYKPSPGAIYPTLQMLEEMGYISATEQDGKKVYNITEQGSSFLEEQRDLANGIRDHIKSKWSIKNIGKMALVMKEYHALEHLLGRGFRTLNTDKAQQIRDVLSRAYRDIEVILQE